MKKTHDYIHYYRGYWSDGDKCRVRIYQVEDEIPVVICSQLPDNENTSVTNMVEYLAAEVIENHDLPTPLLWVVLHPQHEGEPGEYSLVKFSSWEAEEGCLGGVWRYRVGAPRWSSLRPAEVNVLVEGIGAQPMISPTRKKPFYASLNPGLGSPSASLPLQTTFRGLKTPWMAASDSSLLRPVSRT